MSRSTLAPTTLVRCGLYTRKSTEEGLDRDFNSLDAQRESGEAYIKSQANEGWTCLPQRYDDGGFTGGNIDRPALQRLLADVRAGHLDAVVVYKVDRLSRSLLDFARLLEVFEKHNVAFVSVTQLINSATSMGRLMLNVLLSFAQFEREVIGERTRDKIAAARRKGKWSGGHPLLGYDVDPHTTKLVVNEDEASRVRAIFALYLEHQSLLPVVHELNRRGWHNKRWTTRKGPERGGKPFTKTNLHKLLTNVAYTGKVRHKAEVYEGEHDALVDATTWQKVQALLQRNGRTGGTAVRNKFGALLKGLLFCKPCGCAMTPSHSSKNGKAYRYYTCTTAQKLGWDACPSKSIPAGAIEQFVVGQIQRIGQDRELLEETLTQVRQQQQAQGEQSRAERRGLERDLKSWNTKINRLLQRSPDNLDVSQLADLQERIRAGEQRLAELRDDGQQSDVDEGEVAQALADFGPVWAALTPREQTRIVQLLVERVEFDGATHKVALTFHPSGIDALMGELRQHQEAAG